MQNKHLICYLGRNGSGKSFMTNQLVQEQGYVKISMADAMRELLWKILGWKPEGNKDYNKEDMYKKFKDWDMSLKPIIGKLHKDKLIGRVPTIGVDDLNIYHTEIKYLHSVTGRQLLQNIGESCKQMFGEDFWVKQWEAKTQRLISRVTSWNPKTDIEFVIKEKEFAVTDDIRFPIEAEAAHKLGATFIWCDYKNGEYNNDSHDSEALANRILASGKYKHGEEIPFEELQTFF